MKKPSLRSRKVSNMGPPKEKRNILNNILAIHVKKLEKEEQKSQSQENEGNDKISVEINKTETKNTVEKINQGLPWCSRS